MNVLWEGDVVVAGGGSAGCAAAVAAARAGASCLLVESAGFLGGTGAAVLDTFYGFYAPGPVSRRVVGGVGWEVCERLFEAGAAFERPNTYGAGTGVTYEPEELKLVWDALVPDALLHARVCDFVPGTGVVVETVAGRFLVKAPGGDRRHRGRRGGLAGGGHPRTARDAAPADDGHVPARRGRSVRDQHGGAARADGRRRPAAARGVRAPDRERRDRAHQPHPGRGSGSDRSLASCRRPSGSGGGRYASTCAFLRGEGPRRILARRCCSARPHRIGVRESTPPRRTIRPDSDDVLSAYDFPDTIARCGAPIEDHDGGDRTRWELRGRRACRRDLRHPVPPACSARGRRADGGRAGACRPPMTRTPRCGRWRSAWRRDRRRGPPRRSPSAGVPARGPADVEADDLRTRSCEEDGAIL